MLTLTYIWKDSHDMQNTHWDFHVENYDDEDVKDQRGEPKCVNVSQMKLILRMTGIIFWGIKHRILTKAFLLTQSGINLAACCFLLINTFLADESALYKEPGTISLKKVLTPSQHNTDDNEKMKPYYK